jgi:hypothetical protein
MGQGMLSGPTGKPGGACERDARERPSHVPLIVGYGGGVNSLAVVLGLRDRGIRPDLLSFADTGDEHHPTYAYLRDILAPWLAKSGLPPLTTIRKSLGRVGDRTLGENCLRLNTLPSRAFGMSSCAHKWKIEPQEKFLNHWAPAVECWSRGDKPIKILGYDAGEQHRSASEPDKKLRWWYALREWGWDRDDCERRILAEGLPLPPKSSCIYCPSKSKEEVLMLAAEDPEAFAYALRIEDNARKNADPPLGSVKGLGRHWTWRELWEATPEVRAAMPSSGADGCMVCTEGDDA